MGCWVQSATGKEYAVRDGFQNNDPVLYVGVEPVWFDRRNPEHFRGDRELEVVKEKKTASKQEKAAQARAQEKIRAEREDKKRSNRKSKYGARAEAELVAASQVQGEPDPDPDEDNETGEALDPTSLEDATNG